MKGLKLYNESRSLITRLTLLLTLIVGFGTNAIADELTVYDGTNSNRFSPVYGANLDEAYFKSEVIMPKTTLSDMSGKQITKLTFYLSTKANGGWGDARFQVFLKEVDETYFSSASLYGTSGSTIVYTGGLDATEDEMNIVFSSPYLYSGNKNLLIGVYCTTLGSKSNENYFKGTTNYSYPAAYQNTGGVLRNTFYPKTTFTYESPAVATLSIDPDEDAAFGTVWASDSKEYTITNNSGETVNVVAALSGTNASSFSVAPSSRNIAAGSTGTFTLNYSYDSSSLGEKTASITFTPDEDSSNAITKDISVTAVSNFTISTTDGAFGNVTADANKVYTITNHTGKTVNVTPNITGTNADMFSVSPNEETEIADGGSQVFTVTFDWQADAALLDESKTATVLFTPDNGYDAINVDVSATEKAAAVFDENGSSSYTSGSKSLLVKYTPQDGWNTICMPIAMNSSNGIVTNIFGAEWKAYELTNYEAGTLTFSKVISLSSAKPYIVYVPTAASHSDGVLFESVYIYSTSAGNKQPKDSEAVFQGTYAPITAGNFTSSMYGVTSDGQVRPGDGVYANMKGYRAYFTGVSAPAAGVKMVILEDDGGETDLGFVKMVDDKAKDVYTLTGQKVQKGRKGIYIVNGKKVVIK